MAPLQHLASFITVAGYGAEAVASNIIENFLFEGDADTGELQPSRLGGTFEFNECWDIDANEDLMPYNPTDHFAGRDEGYWYVNTTDTEIYPEAVSRL